ncbi:MAG TPA: anti-sigma factor [Sphingobium sp.]|nr:anti-sigma factor [Sphingobium sp.]
MTDIDEAMLIAWVDGELDEVNRRRVDRAVAEDPALAQRLETHRELRQRLAGHYAPVEAEPVPVAMRMLLEESGKVASLGRTSALRSRNLWIGGAIAASLVIGLGIGRMASGPAGPIAVSDGVMVAKGDLASALDTQLASAQQDAPIRIGLSFKRQGGGWCRSFEGSTMSGVACREDESWQIQQLIPGAPQSTEYRQASSIDDRVTATIDALMEGAPADATHEAAARASGWR